MKKIFILAFLIILPLMVIFTQTVNEDIVDLFQKFIATNPENFTMMPLDKNDLLKSSDNHNVIIDKKNYYIKIDDNRLSSGDGSLKSVFTYFKIKDQNGIIAVTHEYYGGDSGGIGDGSNSISFYNYNKNAWVKTSKNLIPNLTFMDYWGKDNPPPLKYRKIKFYYLLPREGSDFSVFAVEDPGFRIYDKKDEIIYTMDKDYESYFNNMKYKGIIFKWDWINGNFIKKGYIDNTEKNRDNDINTSYKTYYNDDYGFKFKYPLNLKFQDTDAEDSFEETHSKLQLFKILELNLKGGFCVYTCPTDKFLEMYNINNLKYLDSKQQPKLINNIKYYTDQYEGPAAMGGQRSEIFSYTAIQDNNCYIFVQEIDYRLYDFATEGGVLPRSLSKNEELSLEKWLEVQKHEYEMLLSSIEFYNISNPSDDKNK